MEHINEEINNLKENDTSNDAAHVMFNPREMMIQMMKGINVTEH
jgi:putative GTP pyrophosphokinase